MSKIGFLRSALADATGFWQRPKNAPEFPDLHHADAERQADSLFRRGRWRMRLGDIEAAIEDFDRSIELLPDFAEAVSSRAECLDMLGRNAAAQPQYEQARHLWAEERIGMPDRSYVFRQQGRLTFEVESYELALMRIRTGSFPQAARGNALLARGQPEKALHCYEQALKFKPMDPALLALKGEALSMMGRYRRAIEQFNASMRANPRAPETLSGRAIAFAALGKIDSANAEWRRQLELLPEGQPAARACVALRLGDYALALPELERALAKTPGHAYWRLYRLTALRRLGRSAEPIEPPPDGEWPAPLFALLAGKTTPEAVLDAATSEGRRAEALFQMDRFREVAERAPPVLIEYAAARNELTRRR